LIRSLPVLARLLLALLILPPVAHAGSYVDFFRALAVDNDRAVRDWLQQGFDPNARSERGEPALVLALREGSPKVARVLAAAPGLKVDEANEAGETPLMLAALRGHRDIADTLLARGAAVSREGWSPLHYAASANPGDVALLRLLIARGAPLDARAPDGSTPLMLAAAWGGEDLLNALLQAGADPRLADARGRTALDRAAHEGRDYLRPALQKALAERAAATAAPSAPAASAPSGG